MSLTGAGRIGQSLEFRLHGAWALWRRLSEISFFPDDPTFHVTVRAGKRVVIPVKAPSRPVLLREVERHLGEDVQLVGITRKNS